MTFAYIDYIKEECFTAAGFVIFDSFSSTIKQAHFDVLKFENTSELPYSKIFPLMGNKDIEAIIIKANRQEALKTQIAVHWQLRFFCPIVQLTNAPINKQSEPVYRNIDYPIYVSTDIDGIFIRQGIKMMRGSFKMPILFKELRKRCRYSLYFN